MNWKEVNFDLILVIVDKLIKIVNYKLVKTLIINIWQQKIIINILTKFLFIFILLLGYKTMAFDLLTNLNEWTGKKFE